MVVMVEDVGEISSKKHCKYGKYESSKHLLSSLFNSSSDISEDMILYLLQSTHFMADISNIHAHRATGIMCSMVKPNSAKGQLSNSFWQS